CRDRRHHTRPEHRRFEAGEGDEPCDDSERGHPSRQRAQSPQQWRRGREHISDVLTGECTLHSLLWVRCSDLLRWVNRWVWLSLLSAPKDGVQDGLVRFSTAVNPAVVHPRATLLLFFRH